MEQVKQANHLGAKKENGNWLELPDIEMKGCVDDKGVRTRQRLEPELEKKIVLRRPYRSNEERKG